MIARHSENTGASAQQLRFEIRKTSSPNPELGAEGPLDPLAVPDYLVCS
jgi:hypothetical protein